MALNLGGTTFGADRDGHVRGAARPCGIEDPEPPDTTAWDDRLSALPINQRRAVVLRHVVGLGIGEISEATGRPEGTVKADIHRGLDRLRRVMEQEQ